MVKGKKMPERSILPKYQARKMAEKILLYLRYCFSLHRFLKHPLSVTECYAIVRDGFVKREANFLSLLRSGVYPNPASPYRKLLDHARCAFEDVESMVNRHGLEKTLQRLAAAGVYITSEEYKGTKPVERNGLSFSVHPPDFDNPNVVPSLEKRSGGTRSSGTRTAINFDFITDGVAVEGVEFDELELGRASYGLWHDGLTAQLDAIKRGVFPDKWFFPTSTNRNILAAYYSMAVARLMGYSVAWPERTSTQEAHKVAEWLAKNKSASLRSVLFTTASSAVRVSVTARYMGLDISGNHFLTGSEPLTPAREREIRAAGCTVTAHYASVETGIIACGCRYSTGDQMHLLESRLSVIQRERQVGYTGVTVNAILLTTLLPASPKIFINMENGDYATIERRPCGCKFAGLGLTDHISHVRSYEKLTSEGMTFFAADLVRIVEEVLPAKFGGSPLDYQAVEEQDEMGLSRLTLIISPRAGNVNEAAVAKTVLEELSREGGPYRKMAKIWQEANTVRVRREEPHPTKRGKVFPFQVR